jgi:glycosyltransferase involved in cell wall biosynthesis
MARESIPWPLRWIVDEDRRDTGFAMLRRSIGHGERPAFDSMAVEHRFVGFTHFGPFPLYHEAYDGRRPGHTPQAGWERPEVRACDAWAHCFRDPDRYLPPGPPRMLVSGSDFVHEQATWRAAYADGRAPRRWDLVYSCLPTWLNELQKNWDLARACVVRLAEAGARIVIVGRAGTPGLPPHPNIDYLPQLPWREFVQVTAAARVAFLPNWWDASPRVITEALAVDVPVLVNRRILGGWKYVAPETGAFFDDESDVVEALFAVLDGPLAPRQWLLANGYGQDNAARRLAAELRALGGPARGELAYALPTSDRPRDA